MSTKQRLVPVPEAVRELTASELNNILATTPEDHPVWLAVNQVLADHAANARSQATNPAVAASHGTLAFAVGGTEALSVFQADLWDQYRKAHGAAAAKAKLEAD